MISITRPLVTTGWLAKTISSPHAATASLRILDVTWTPKGTGPDIYKKGHIPGSYFFDLLECRNKDSPYRVTLPSPKAFEDYIGCNLGIDNSTDIIIYDNDPVLKVKNSGRVWWMFRIFGHHRVSVLDGGMAQWIKDGYPVTQELPKIPEPVKFMAMFNPKLLKKFEDIRRNQEKGEFQLLDSRPEHWYDGTQPSQLPDLPTGTIKNSSFLPYPTLFKDGSTKFRSPDEIKTIFASKGIDLSRPLTTTCNVGVTANMLTLAAFIVGKEDVAVYDGSWDEFAQIAPEEAMELNPYVGPEE